MNRPRWQGLLLRSLSTGLTSQVKEIRSPLIAHPTAHQELRKKIWWMANAVGQARYFKLQQPMSTGRTKALTKGITSKTMRTCKLVTPANAWLQIARR